MNITLGINIKKLRTKKKITQKQFAAYLGVTEQAVSRWEACNGFPDIRLIPSIASFFSVTTDELLGVTMTERESRLAQIRRKIDEINETGETTVETVEEARIWTAEFPGEDSIQEHLANELCRFTMWDEKPKMGLLKEAEKIYRTLIDTADDQDFRNNIIEKLAVLYAIGFRDLMRAEDAADLLPTMKYSREFVKASVFSAWAREHNDTEQLKHMQDYMERLTDSLGNVMTEYVIQDIPNNAERWDEKIGYFEKIIELYKFVFGEDMLFYHDRVAYLWRVIATYKVAQGKNEETLDCLEKMVHHALLADRACPGDRYSSVFTDQLIYPGNTEDFDGYVLHNAAYYCRHKMDQDRYNPIRETDRFKEICATLEKGMK